MGINPWCDVVELWQRKLGIIPELVVNDAMRRGHELEPEARLLLELETGIRFPAACYEDTEHPFLTASVDGICSTGEIISEIKCPGMTTHVAAITTPKKVGKVPAYYVCQCQHNMGVTGAKLCYYYSYLPDVEDVQTTVKIEIPRDDEYIERIKFRCIKFKEHLDNKTEPDPEWFGVKDAGILNGTFRTDPAWNMAIQEALTAKNVLEDAQRQYKARLERLTTLMSRKKQVLVTGNRVRVERIQVGDNWETVITTEDV